MERHNNQQKFLYLSKLVYTLILNEVRQPLLAHDRVSQILSFVGLHAARTRSRGGVVGRVLGSHRAGYAQGGAPAHPLGQVALVLSGIDLSLAIQQTDRQTAWSSRSKINGAETDFIQILMLYAMREFVFGSSLIRFPSQAKDSHLRSMTMTPTDKCHALALQVATAGIVAPHAFRRFANGSDRFFKANVSQPARN